MTTIRPLLAKILIQIGADEPKEIGTIEIPIEVSIPTKTTGEMNITINAMDTADPSAIAAEVNRRVDAYRGI